MSTRDVSLADYEIASCKSFYVIADVIDDADKLVTNRHRHRNRFLRPRVPVINVHVGSADGSFQHPNEHIIAPNFWSGKFLEPQTTHGFWLHIGIFYFIHGNNLGEAALQQNMALC